MINTLPTDLSRKIIKEYLYSEVIRELSQYHHSQRFKPVLTEMIEERPGSLDEYLVNRYGVFIRPNPGWFDRNNRYFIRMEPKDSSRLQAYDPDFFFEIVPTPGTQKLLDDFRRRGVWKNPNIDTEAMSRAKKYYEVYVTTCNRGDKPVVTRIFTLERNDCQNEEYDYIQLPMDWFDLFSLQNNIINK
jgi:hypothetical protein